MAEQRPKLEELNAYVDNELPAERAADIAQAIARYPDVAEKVATLARLRSVLASSVEPPPLTLPRTRKPAVRHLRWLVAACIAIVCVSTAAWLYPMGQTDGRATWMETALGFHEAWQPAAGASSERSGDRLVPASQKGNGIVDAYVPDLSATKLSIAYVNGDAEVAGAPAIVVGYTGTRGCKLTLIASRSLVPVGEERRFYDLDGKAAYGWRIGEIGHILIADGMDPVRFDLIAENVYRASIERLPFDNETRTALLQNRHKSKPCPV